MALEINQNSCRKKSSKVAAKNVRTNRLCPCLAQLLDFLYISIFVFIKIQVDSSEKNNCCYVNFNLSTLVNNHIYFYDNFKLTSV